MDLRAAKRNAQSFFLHLRSVRGPLFASLLTSIVLAFPQQVIEIYRSIAQSEAFSDASVRRRELALLGAALCIVSAIVWVAARTSTRSSWRSIRSADGRWSVAPLINIAIAVLPFLGASLGCYNATTLPLTPAAKEAAGVTLSNIILAGGGKPTPELIKELLPSLLDYNWYLAAGAWGFVLVAAVVGAALIWFEHRLLRREAVTVRNVGSMVVATAAVVAALLLFLVPPWVATKGGPVLMFCIFAGSAAIVLSALSLLSDRSGIPLVGTLIAYVAVISYFELNDNHRAFTIKAASVPAHAAGLPKLEDEFRLWLKERNDRVASNDRRYPVYIVAVQGGGIYAAYHAASVLAAIQDSCPAFVQHLFAISGVSGGSLGAAVFAAVAKAGENGQTIRRDTVGCVEPSSLPKREAAGEFSVVRVAEKLLETDFLAPVVYGLLVPDLLQLFVPRPVTVNDRARQFEFALEGRTTEVLSTELSEKRLTAPPPNLLAQRYAGHWAATGNLPALVLNTTEVGTGGRRIIAPFSFPSDDAFFLPINSPDLEGMPLSTAAILSARFPWVTPPGWYREKGDGGAFKNYLVDGGYYDNSGVATALDIVRIIKSMIDVASQIDLRLLILSSPNERANETFFGIEALAPVQAILRVRAASARRTIAQAERELGVDTLVNERLQVQRANLLDLGYPPPLGWRLSLVSAFLIEAQNGLSETCDRPSRTPSDRRYSASCIIESVRHDFTGVVRKQRF